MTIQRVEWKVAGFMGTSAWFKEFGVANQLRSDLEDAARLLQVEFDLRPQVVEVEVKE